MADKGKFDAAKFAAWKKKVDAYIAAKTGLTSDDLADQCYADWFIDGVSPKSAAARAIKYEMGN